MMSGGEPTTTQIVAGIVGMLATFIIFAIISAIFDHLALGDVHAGLPAVDGQGPFLLVTLALKGNQRIRAAARLLPMVRLFLKEVV